LKNLESIVKFESLFLYLGLSFFMGCSSSEGKSQKSNWEWRTGSGVVQLKSIDGYLEAILKAQSPSNILEGGAKNPYWHLKGWQPHQVGSLKDETKSSQESALPLEWNQNTPAFRALQSCFQKNAGQQPWSGQPDAHFLSKGLSIFAPDPNWFDPARGQQGLECLTNTQSQDPSKNPLQNSSEESFLVGTDFVYFTPSPLYALFVYEGSWNGYAEALVAAVPSASVPLDVACARADGICLESPLPKSRCKGCSSLEPSRVYTAFLLREKSELSQNVLKVKVQFALPEN
jgi:hypothetical protein